MCGIVGFVLKAPGNEDTYQQLAKGLMHIQHRGPDSTGVWRSAHHPVGFGHARLSVIDPSSGTQPMHSPDKRFTLVYNGEIYNYLELRQVLGEEKFTTDSDTEVILQAFMHWGSDCVNHLRGMFAFAIWDDAEQRLFLARDRFGIKPLYWMQTDSGFYFASEIKGLLPFMSDRQVHAKALCEYFTFQFCLEEKTLTHGVYALPAGHHANLHPEKPLYIQRYWDVHYIIDYDHTERWFTERLRELLYESVRLHLRADVSVGSYVSGGIDSSLLASIARQIQSDGLFHIFNGRFLDHPDFDESPHAACLAETRDMQLHIIDISEQDFVDSIEKVIWHLDQPTAGPGAFPQYMVSKAVSQHLKVVLGGQGGDEIFGGYARYLVAYFEQCIKGAIEGTLHHGNYVVTYESIIPNLQALKQYKPMLSEFWAQGLFETHDARYWRLINRANTLSNILEPEFMQQSATFESFQRIFSGENVGKSAYFDAMTHFDFKTLLPALLQVEDRMSMAHGVEARVPFLDHPLIEFAATIPADIKFRNGELKRLLKTVLSSYLPTSITVRKDKMGFPVPLNLWLKRQGPTREYISDLLSSQKARTRPYFKQKLSVDDFFNCQNTYNRNIWALLSLEIWHRQFID